MTKRTTTVKMDERGRIYVPKSVRSSLDIVGEEVHVELTIEVLDE